MWIVHPNFIHNSHNKSVIHLDVLLHIAHLIPIYSSNHLPIEIDTVILLDTFRAYYVKAQRGLGAQQCLEMEVE
jgi:hypothetical protein